MELRERPEPAEPPKKGRTYSKWTEDEKNEFLAALEHNGGVFDALVADRIPSKTYTQKRDFFYRWQQKHRAPVADESLVPAPFAVYIYPEDGTLRPLQMDIQKASTLGRLLRHLNEKYGTHVQLLPFMGAGWLDDAASTQLAREALRTSTGVIVHDVALRAKPDEPAPTEPARQTPQETELDGFDLDDFLMSDDFPTDL